MNKPSSVAETLHLLVEPFDNNGNWDQILRRAGIAFPQVRSQVRLPRLIALATVVFCMLAAAAFATGLIEPELLSTGDDPELPVVTPAPKLSDPPTQSRPAPAPNLGSPEMAAAKAITAADPTLRSILDGRTYVITEAVPWVNRTIDHQVQIVGADLTLSLSEPLSTRTPLPAAAFDDSSDSYRKIKVYAAIEDATALTVLVDLRTAELVTIHPDKAAKVTELPGNTHDPEGVGK